MEKAVSGPFRLNRHCRFLRHIATPAATLLVALANPMPATAQSGTTATTTTGATTTGSTANLSSWYDTAVSSITGISATSRTNLSLNATNPDLFCTSVANLGSITINSVGYPETTISGGGTGQELHVSYQPQTVTLQNVQSLYPKITTVLDPAFSQTLDAMATGSKLLLSSSLLNQHGAHSRPLLRRVGPGQNTFWVTGDLGQDDHGSRNGDIGLAEIGYGRNFGLFQMNLSIGTTGSEQHLALNGKAVGNTTFILAESLIPLNKKLWVTLGGYKSWGKLTINRNYLVGDVLNTSNGTPSSALWGVRGRIDAENALHIAPVGLSPYLDFSYCNASTDGFTESGGDYPIIFDKQHQQATELRLGLNITLPVARAWSLVGTVEGTHLFEPDAVATTGEIIGVSRFNITGSSSKQNWLRTALGIDGKIMDNQKATWNASLTGNLTTEGEVPNFWIAANLQLVFK